MKETLESSPAEFVPQDKKNYASDKGADKNISANNSRINFITIANKKAKPYH